MRMFLYMLFASICFSVFYMGHKQINQGQKLYEDRDSVLFAVIAAALWFVTVWFVVPWLVINLYPFHKKENN